MTSYASQDETIRARAEVEAAGPPGDTSFLRGQVQAEVAKALPGLWPLQGFLAGMAGVLLPLDRKPSCLQDRFFLGGASGSAGLRVLRTMCDAPSSVGD